jgi:RNA polymerase sigma factor (sigma-70 family)
MEKPMQEHGANTGALAKRAQEGDIESFTTLIRNYQAMAFGYAYSRLGDFDLAEDAAQQAFITAYRSLAKLRQPERFGGWLRSIVYFECSRILRHRSSSDVPLDAAGNHVGASDPHEQVVSGEETARVIDAIRALPQAEREVTILVYLHGHSQREVADFLSVPVSTVNNRLRTARKGLKKELVAMADNTFNEHRLPESFASRVGAIVRADGPVVDARFDTGDRPRVLTALTVTADGSEPVTTVEAIQLLENGLVRCIPITPGMPRIDTEMQVIDTGGPVRIPLQPDAVRQVMSSIEAATVSPVFMETGIKVIDLMTPLPQRGRIALTGDMNTGKMVLIDELIYRLDGTATDLTAYVFVQTPEEVEAIHALEYRASRNVAAIYLPVTDARPEALVDLTNDLDAVITLSRELAKQQLWPAIDPVRSTSRVLSEGRLEAGHLDTATRVRHALNNTPNSRPLREYLAQPFFVAEPYTGRQGTRVPLQETIRNCQALIASNDV